MQRKFQQLLQEEHLTGVKLAEMLEVQPAVISHMLSGRNKPSFQLIQKILRCFPHLNPYWLLLDAPNMYKDDYIAGRTSHEISDLSATHSLFAEQPAKAGDKATLTHRESNIFDTLHNEPGIFNSRDISSGAPAANHTPDSLPDFTTSVASAGALNIERIIVLYSDGTFRDFAKR